MADGRKSGSHAREETLDRLLEESRALRARSEELTIEVERLRAEMDALEGHQKERRKKPRLKGK